MTSAKQRRLQALDLAGYDLSGHHKDWITNVDYTEYDAGTGKIITTGFMSVGALRKFETGHGRSFLRTRAELGVHYVDLSGAAPRRRIRSTCPARLAGHTLANLPVPCTVKVVDAAQDTTLIQCDEPQVALVFDYPGTYTVTVQSVPHTDGLFVVEVP